MSFLKLKQAVLAIPEGDRIAFLRTKGYKTQQDAEDMLRFLLMPSKPTENKPVEKPDRFREVMERAAAFGQKLKANPPAPKEGLLTPFERDVLHTRHIMGGPTVHDTASYHNPNLRQTETTRWLVNEFMPSGMHFALILGNPGAGKTFGALAYVNRIAQVEVNVGKIQRTNARYVHAYRLAEMISEHRKFRHELDDLTRGCGVLMLDDLGTEPEGWKGKDFDRHFGYLIDERYKFRKKTIITSNTTLDKFNALYGEAVTSRFAQVGMFLETQDPDLRRIEHG